MSRRYRACSARCAEILDNLKDPLQVEPAYLIYLHFYAAASMEMCTRPLPLTSAYRAALLQQARNHYDRATSLIQAAEDSVAVKTRSNSVASSRCSSSLHSPSSSVNSLCSISSSRTWTAETGLSSPTNSIYSFDGPVTPQSSPRRARPPKRVKKVSFSLPLCAEELEEEQEHDSAAAAVANFRFPEPAIRPDSPTLGFDEEYFHAGASLSDLPAPPLPPPPPPKSSLRPLPPPPPPITVAADHLPPFRPEDELLPDDDDDDAFFRVERSVHRYNETLSRLRTQLASHSQNLGAQLVLAADLGSSRPSTPCSSPIPTSPSAAPASPRSFTFERRDNAEATRAAEKQARIERLRKNGWVRKRFDGRRYEELAKEVLAELEG